MFTFVDDVVGQQPGYISLPWAQANVEVVESDWALDGRALRIDPYGSNGFFAAVLEPVPELVNAEVLMRFRDSGGSSSANWMSGVGARVGGTAGSETGVVSQTLDASKGLLLGSMNDGAVTKASTFPVAKDNYLRTRWEGGVVSAKMWGGSLADEPAAWSVVEHGLTKPTLDSGGVAITRYLRTHTTEVDYITVDVLPPPAGLRVMPVGDSITIGDPFTDEPQPTYRMFLYDHLVASGLVADRDFEFVGPDDTHPSTEFGYVRQGQWDHDATARHGRRTEQMLPALEAAVGTYDPHVLLFLIGINDIVSTKSSPQLARDNLDQAITIARAQRSDVQIVLAEIPPGHASYDAEVVAYNGLVRELAAMRTTELSPVVSVDLHTGYDPALYHRDRVHPNALGDELIASRFATTLHTAFGIGNDWEGSALTPVVPLVEITAGPSGTVAVGDATFEFVSDTAGASFECRWDGNPFAVCASPYEVTGLVDGGHSFEVRVIAEGVTGGSVSRSWTVDTSQPVSGMVSVDPGSLDFGEVEVGSSGVAAATLTNTGGESVSVTGASVEGSAGFVVSNAFPIELGPAGSVALEVVFAPDVVGTFEAAVSVAHSGSNDAPVIGLLGQGVSAPVAPVSEVSAGDADHVFTFVDDVVGQQPGYISLPWAQANVEVVESDWALDGRALRIDPYGSNGFFAAVLEPVPAQIDTEMLMRFRDTGASSNGYWMSGVGARVGGAAGSETAVLAQSLATSRGLVLATVTGGAYAHKGFPVAKDNYLRARWEGGVVSAKMWGGTLADEPAGWSVVDYGLTQPTMDPGGVAITRYFAKHTTEVDYITIDELTTPS